MAGQLIRLLQSRSSRLPQWIFGILCALLAIVGAVPLVVGLALQTDWAQEWIAAQTRSLLRSELGLDANYTLSQRLWPLRITLSDISIAGTGAEGKALTVERMVIRPRWLTLLGGRLQVGEVDIVAPRGRLVFKQGQLSNIRYRLPKRADTRTAPKHAPFSKVRIRDATLEVRFDEVSARLGKADIELFAGPGLSFRGSIAVDQSHLTRVRRSWDGPPGPEKGGFPYEYDEDALCSLHARVGYEGKQLRIESFTAKGVADPSGKPDTRPDCADSPPDPAQLVRVEITRTSIDFRQPSNPRVEGQLLVRGPAWIANRFARLPRLNGWTQLDVKGVYDGRFALPQVSGVVVGDDLGLDDYRIAKDLRGDLVIAGTRIAVPRLELGIADGRVTLHETVVAPFAPGVPVTTRLTETRGMTFPGLMRDLGVTEHTVVAWHFGQTDISRIRGTLHPLHLDADIESRTTGFQVFDRGWDDPARRPMVAVPSASVRGRIGVRPTAFQIYEATSSFGSSSVVSELVSIGFDNDLEITIREGSIIELADVGPLAGIPVAGRSRIKAHLEGKSDDPLLAAEMSIDDFVFGGYPVGSIKQSRVRFRPLWLELEEVVSVKGTSTLNVPMGRIDFGTGAAVTIEAHVGSQRLDVRDFLAMWHLDDDPRWDGFEGKARAEAHVRYALGGGRDRCGAGRLEVEGEATLSQVLLFGERYDSGSAQFALDWSDMDAKANGMSLALNGLTLRKGEGTVVGGFTVTHGGTLDGTAVATSVPLREIDSLGALRTVADGRASGVLKLGGALDSMQAHASVAISPVRLGDAVLAASELEVAMLPAPARARNSGISACGGAIPPPFDLATYKSDPSEGEFRVSGQMFGGQIRLDKLTLTRQRQTQVAGILRLDHLDVGALSGLVTTFEDTSKPLRSTLTGTVQINEFAPSAPSRANVVAHLDDFEIVYGEVRARLLRTPARLALSNSELVFPDLSIGVSGRDQPATIFEVRGALSKLNAIPVLDATLELEPFDVSRLTRAFPQLERSTGRVSGAVTATGPLTRVRYTGQFELADGEFILRGAPWPISAVRVVVALNDDQVRVLEGRAKLGSGLLSMSGSAVLDGTNPRDLRLELQASGVRAPLDVGVEGLLNARLVLEYDGQLEQLESPELPTISGDVQIASFAYTRPVTMSVDIAELTRRGSKTVVDAYDPSLDQLRFDIGLHATRPLRIANNLLDAELDVAPEGLRLQGTNQRVGLVGKLRVRPGGRIQLRRNEFELRDGFVRFDDATRIAPQVDVTATTEYRRYSDSFEAGSSGSQNAGAAASAMGGRWLITMRAHGDAEQLKVDLSSDPALAQDDIFLLLTVGVTRAELDQSQSTSVGESVALEALGHISGADEVVSDAIPVIDEFRFGSAYSSRAGRTEPTITVGKRLAERIRASVTTGVAESREVRSKLEWRLSPRLSVEGSYDNVNDISSSALGNLGGDLRWRLEFE